MHSQVGTMKINYTNYLYIYSEICYKLRTCIKAIFILYNCFSRYNKSVNDLSHVTLKTQSFHARSSRIIPNGANRYGVNKQQPFTIHVTIKRIKSLHRKPNGSAHIINYSIDRTELLVPLTNKMNKLNRIHSIMDYIQRARLN